MSSCWQVNQNVVDGVGLLNFSKEIFLSLALKTIFVVFRLHVQLDLVREHLAVVAEILMDQIVTVLVRQRVQLILRSLVFWRRNLFSTLVISKHGKLLQKMEQA